MPHAGLLQYCVCSWVQAGAAHQPWHWHVEMQPQRKWERQQAQMQNLSLSREMVGPSDPS